MVDAAGNSGGIAVDGEKHVGTAVGGKAHYLKEVEVVGSSVADTACDGLIALVGQDFHNCVTFAQVGIRLIVMHRVVDTGVIVMVGTVIAIVAAMTGIYKYTRFYGRAGTGVNRP